MKLKKKLVIGIFCVILAIILFFQCQIKEPFTNSNSSQIPNQIWAFWEGEIPYFIHKCIHTWKKHNPTYVVTILNKENISNYLNKEEIKKVNHPIFSDIVQRYSDAVRLSILSKYGGFWMDASIICHRSFDWVHDIQKTTNAEFFGFYINVFTLPEYRNKADVIESWFFACIPNSHFVNCWYQEFMSISNYSSVDKYIKNLYRQGINKQLIKAPNYLAIHMSAQKLLQKQKKNEYNLYLLKAEDIPFKYLEDNHWNTEVSVDKVLNHQYDNLYFLKLTAEQRSYMMNKDYSTYFDKL